MFQIFAPKEETRETSIDVIEEVKAKEYLVHPHHRAASKPRQEGFEPNEEEASAFNISSTEHKTGSSAIHKENRDRARQKETQTGVRKNVVQYLVEIFFILLKIIYFHTNLLTCL